MKLTLHEIFLRQFALASAEVEKLRLLYPGCFDENGRAIVAEARLLPPLDNRQTTGGKP
jgi:hypothetical protein